MSTQGNTLLQKLVLYGNSGSDSVFMDISAAVQRGDKFGTIHMNLALKVSKHIFRILDHGTKLHMVPHAMACLMAMCESDKNSEARKFLQSLKNTTILTHCVFGCQQRQHPPQLLLCMYILYLYASDSDERSCEMLQHTGLLEAVLIVIQWFQQDGDTQVNKASKQAVLLLQILIQCTHPLERIVRAGGRQALDVLLGIVAAVGRATLSNPPDNLTAIIDNCVKTCIICYESLLKRNGELIEAGLSLAGIFYSTEQAVHIMESWHMVFVYVWNAHISDDQIMDSISSVLMFCMSGCITNKQVQAISSRTCSSEELVTTSGAIETRLCSIFRVKAPSMDDHTVDDTFIRFVLNVAMQCECEGFADHIFEMVCMYPTLKIVVEECVGRYRYCAHPDCSKCSFVQGMYKCARCRSHSVWYCGKEHQIAHWPEHKLACRRHNGSTVAKPV